MTKGDLFLKLAQPNKEGISRWVNVSEFIGKYAGLQLGNGLDWGRPSSKLARTYNIETQKKGSAIDKIRLNGFNKNLHSQYIRNDIKKEIKSLRCVILGTSNPEVDHKNGMKNEDRVMLNENQTLDDFQPLSKAANDAKRQFCKDCRKTGIRFDAKLLGYPMSYYAGTDRHNNQEDGCIGCFWYDPIEFRKHLKKK